MSPRGCISRKKIISLMVITTKPYTNLSDEFTSILYNHIYFISLLNQTFRKQTHIDVK